MHCCANAQLACIRIFNRNIFALLRRCSAGRAPSVSPTRSHGTPQPLLRALGRGLGAELALGVRRLDPPPSTQ